MRSEFDFFSELHLNFLSQINFDYEQQSTLIIDLVTIMGAIYYKDVDTPKSDDKPRLIEITIPVFNSKLWSKMSGLIEELAKWVSADTFKVNFKETSFKTNSYVNSLIPPIPNNVTLFSGGLDSLSGAYNNYKNRIQSDYLGFINKDEEKTKQIEVAKFYKEIFDKTTEIILIDKPISKKKTLIQSTRSLLYLALAIAKAYFNSSKNVYLYENGILSLNPEIKNRYTTKTTHPKTIYLYSLILERLNIEIKINHPFLFKTKGEITNEMDEKFKKTIKHTFTCGQGRSHVRTHKGQCGVCIPCILRKISLAAYDNEGFDVNYQYPYDVKVNQIKEELYRKDYASNLNYFKSYYDLIKAKRIHLEIHTREKYYKGDSDFRSKNNKMFNKFAEEYERFMEKYAPY
jgi:7-cyano-7-deazaguanine synthase in queuosine biosynthesis